MFTQAMQQTHCPSIVLIHPPAVSKRYLKTKFMPYGMAVLKAFLRDHGIPAVQHDFLMQYLFDSPEDPNYHDPEKTFSARDIFGMLDGSRRHKGLESFCSKYVSPLEMGAQIYAFSIVSYHQFWAALLMAKQLKLINPTAKVVFGGPFITIRPAETFARYGMADYWVKGSGEVPLLILFNILSGRSDEPLEVVPGLIHLRAGGLVCNPQSSLTAEEERAPDFEGLGLNQYRYEHPGNGTNTLFLPYRITKGCPSRCTFCTGRLVDRFSHKSPGKAVSELVAISRRYQANTFQFADASINARPDVLSELCDRLVEEFPSIRWYSYARVLGFDPDLLRKVRKAGCFSLFWGVEAASQHAVDLLGKGFDIGRMFETVDEAIAAGIKNYIHIMYNTPHETTDDVKAFMALVDRYLDSDLVVFLPQRFLLEPQSLMHQHPDRHELENLRPASEDIFAREEFLFDETPATPSAAVQARNSLHAGMLADHLAAIRYRNLLASARHPWARRIPTQLMVQLDKRSNSWPPAAWARDLMVRWIQSVSDGLREQL